MNDRRNRAVDPAAAPLAVFALLAAIVASTLAAPVAAAPLAAAEAAAIPSRPGGTAGSGGAAGEPPVAVFCAVPGREASAILDGRGNVHLLSVLPQGREGREAPLAFTCLPAALPALPAPSNAPPSGLLPLAAGDGALSFHPALYRQPEGPDPLAAWVERGPDGCRLFHSRWLAAERSWAAAEPVLDGPVDLLRFPHGSGPWLVWVQSSLGKDDILACRRGPSGWEEPVRVSRRDGTEDLAPRVALDSRGEPWVVWAGSVDGGQDEILFSRRREGEWSAERVAGRRDETPDALPDLAIAPGGPACAVWLAFTPESGVYEVVACTSPDGDDWSAKRRLGPGTFSSPPRVTWLAGEGFLVLWADPQGALWQAVCRNRRWDGPQRVQPADPPSRRPQESPVTLLYRPTRAGGEWTARACPIPADSFPSGGRR